MKGNPVAVVIGADALSDQQMADFANWTNLSETTFLLKPTTPEADYRLRNPETWSIAALAFAHGFGSASTSARVFRVRYGISASEMHEGGAPATHANLDANRSALANCLTALG